ncbi:MAG: hypothetical protein ACR2QH_00920, partial [Geminicoccaceae bacterium]
STTAEVAAWSSTIAVEATHWRSIQPAHRSLGSNPSTRAIACASFTGLIGTDGLMQAARQIQRRTSKLDR